MNAIKSAAGVGVGPKSRLPFSIYMLSLAQGLGLSCAVIAVTIAALAGLEMTDIPHLATVAYGLQFVTMIPAAFLSSNLMKTSGRKPVLLVACCSGILSGIVASLAVINSSLLLLCIGHILLGVFLANIQLLRFAALDMTEPAMHSRVIPLVLLGGVFAALLGPTLARSAGAIVPLEGYAAIYLLISFIALCVLIIIILIPMPNTSLQARGRPIEQVRISKLLQTPGFIFAVFCGGSAYFLMSLLMVSASMFLKHPPIKLEFAAISLLIQAHVLAMYLPSLFSGRIQKKIGIWNFLALGIVMQLGSNITAILADGTHAYLLSLVLLGIAWNFLFTSGTCILGGLFSGNDKFKAQGFNDMIIALLTSISTLGAASLLTTFGWNALNGISIVVSLGLFIYAWKMRLVVEIREQGS